ncbi:MAG: Ig-like domain-containing protein, partial [Aquisalimonadaceae bacterium]
DESEAETAFTVYGVAPAGHVLARRVNGRVEGGMAGAPQMSVQEARLILPEYEYAFGTVTLDGAHLTMAGGMHTADTLDLVNGSVLTHTAAAASTDAGLFITAQRVQVEAGSRINVSGRGPSAAESGFRTGGSHGGRGGRGESASDQSNAEHGDVLAPVSQGSAGNGGRRGGGAFRLVAEELVLEGEILADGTAGTANASHGGGSGGSIWLDVDTLSGGGLVRAAGGDAGHWAGGGGGGRVAVYYGTLAFEMERVTAPGGARGAGNHPNSQHGGAGTVYLRQRDAALGAIRIEGVRPWAETAFTVYSVPSDDLTVREVQGRLDYVAGGANLSLQGSRLTLPEYDYTFGTVTLIGNSVLTHVNAAASTDAGLFITAARVEVEAGSRIDVSGRGPSAAESGFRTGGSHGGRGGRGESASDQSNAEHGDVLAPVSQGSAGNGGRRGGGAFRLVAEELVLEGEILADGTAGTANASHGGGSGGSIWLDVDTLSGGGLVRAAGGDAGHWAGGGGGGRVAVYYGTLAFEMERVTAPGGARGAGNHPNSQHGGAGTVYLRQRDAAQGVFRLVGDESEAETAFTVYGVAPAGPLLVRRTYGRVEGLADTPGLDLQEAWLTLPANDYTFDAVTLDGAQLTMAGGLRAAGALHVINGGLLTHFTAAAADSQGLLISADLIHVDETSAINVSGRGLPVVTGTQERAGGSYGGLGGELPSRSASSTNPVFGSETAPVDFGTGGAGNSASTASRGGGALRVIANELQLVGEIRADGAAASSGGGGSGGSIWIDAGILSGSGFIHANGGNGFTGGGGGGGRVAVYYGGLTDFDLQRVSVAGGAGDNGGIDGQAGSVVTEAGRYPLQVTAFEPVGERNGPVEVMTAWFTLPLDPASITHDEVNISGPQGAVVHALTLRDGDRALDIRLASPLEMEGIYEVRIGPDIRSSSGYRMDQNGDGEPGDPVQDVFVTTFTLDTTRPAPPTVNSQAPLPEEHALTSLSVALAGSRDAGTRILVNGTPRVAFGDSDWSTTVSLTEGVNDITVTAEDLAGNHSEPVELRFVVDTTPPKIGSITPAHNTYMNTPPEAVTVGFVEEGSGLDLAASTLALRRNGGLVSGSWRIVDNHLVFSADTAFTEAVYQLDMQLVDHAGWSSGPQQVLFTVDQTPPRPPVLDPIPEATNTRWLQVRGTKEAGTGILVNGEVLAALSVQTDWTGEVELQEGANTLQFMAVDRAGNASVAVTVTVHYSNVAPGPVAVTVDPNGDGRTLSLDWSSYNEAANGGDIRDYAVFLSTTPFSDISSAAVAATLPAGVKTYAAQGLTRGQTYHIAVVATDELGNRLTGVHPVAAMPVDVEAPAEVKSLQVEGGESYLAFTWLAPLDEDLAGYRLYADGGELLAALPVGEATYRIEALDAAEAVTLRVTTHDHDDNASTGVVKTGVTHLHNPAGVEATGLHSMADVSWLPVTPANLVLRYAVYVSEQAFTDVAGMTPRLLVGADRDSARVAGLHNGVTYFVAVTAINLSGGERTAVTPVEVIPEADQDGPEISGLRFNGEPLVEGAVLTAAGTVSVEASDESGISQVRFQVNDQVLGTATGNAGTYTAAWNVPAFDDGVYTLQIAAWDVHDNRSDLQVSVVIELGAPQPPTLTVPANGHRTNDALLWVEGTAEVNTSVTLYRNGTAVLDGLAAGGNGRFSGQIELDEGENVIHATATNRGGESAPGNARTVWLDTAMPAAPAGLQAMARAGGEIRLAWSVLSMEGVTHYDIYRASDAFETPDAAQRINQQPVKTGAFTDLPDVEGRYYYRVVAVNEVGTAGHPSNQASAMADSTPPRVLRIDYEPHGPHDPFSGRIAPGRVDLRLDVSEPLLTTPFLSITPSNGVPLSVALQRVSETLYEGSFEVREHTPSGTAYAVFSGRDEVGNRGTEIDDGRTLQFDTDGPVVTDLTVTPGHPIRNDAEAPVTVAVIVTLSEEVQPGTQPELTYLLSGDGRVETAMDSLVQLDELRWRGGFTLPADAGLEQPEAMQFQFSALDDLHNRGNRLPADVFIQVYQGDLPPLDAPTGLRATAAPGGAIQLEWDAVEAAADYALYRQTPDGDALIALTRTDGTTTYTDQTSVDGEYLYAVATVREDNAQQSVGAMSSPVAVVAISQPPAAPTALDLTFLPQGMRLSWAHVHDGELPVTFNVYRSQGLQVPTVDGLEPLLTGVQELHALDAAPSENAYAYAVSAVDAAGNESALSASAFLNPGLLPVGTFEVLQDRDAKPELTWIHVSQSLDGFDLYLGADAAGHRLGGGRIAGTRYVDGGYADDERLYTIIAVDGNGLESLPRSLLLPAISAEPDAEAQLLRGIMNRLPYVVSNQGDHAASNIRLHAVIGQHGGVSEAFDLAPGQTLTVPVIFGGHDDLPNLARLTTTVDVRPNPGERSRSVREVDLIVGDAGLVLDLSTREFRRGAPGEVQFSLENTSEVDIEIITARNQGKANSGEIRFHMLDADDNVLATGGFRQFSGANVITLADGRTVARIPAGETFTSVWTGFAVPAAAPDQVRIRVQIDALHYRLGSAESVSINGPRSSRQVTVSDTSYHGNVVDIAPASSFGDQPVLIQGQALARGTDQPLGGVPLNLVIAGNGYERSHQVYADSEGMFTHTFKPLAGESGIYTVSVLHPDITDRPAHGGFTIGRVAVRPSQASLHGAVNIPQEIPIRVAAGAATDVSNVRLHIDPAAQPGGMWPEGLEADLGQPADLASGTERTLMLRLTADNRVPENGTVNVDVLSDDTGDQVLGRVRVDYRFTEAVPTLHWTPNFVETGVAHGGSVADVITLQNRGLAALEDVRVQLLTVQGAQAPAWIYLASPENQGTLDVGDERKIQLIASPGESIADGVYHFKLRIRSANHPTREANIYVAVTQSGVGSVLFRATDIYTATL